MKIILVAPKSITKHKWAHTPFRFDYAYWNFYLPLLSLGHQVVFFDTSIYGDPELATLIEHEKPDLLFCIMTGNPAICPGEPWDIIKKETESGRTLTFNWFCDDAWRFEDFSKEVCWNFNAVATTDSPEDVEKYKEIGYNNSIYAPWHANSDVYSGIHSIKTSHMCFVGSSYGDREEVFEAVNKAGVSLFHYSKISFEDMIWNYSRAWIGLNLSKNNNDSTGKLILKARPFEITAVGSLLVTQNAVGLSDCYEIDKEVVTFDSTDELIHKCKYLIDNPQVVNTMAANGHKRFLAEHDSKVRLAKVLQKIRRV
jgi:spore maturation protein CgeB